MTLNQAIKILTDYYERANKAKYVRKPLSWALYRTWVYVNAREKEREVGNADRGQD
ncbi:MAG: hypothetical protein J6S67_14980 [Methanobrevibacter sp.]|nr:hypothetical protein [Methanobrevibacter sp.]